MRIRTESKKSEIVAAAAELFKEVGYERASMNELAKRLGGSKATLYGYFPSKESLFSAVVRSCSVPYLTQAAEVVQAPARSRTVLQATLLSFAEKMLQVLANDADALAVYRMVVAEAGRSEVGEFFHESGPSESLDALAKWLGEAINRGYLRKGDPMVFAQQFTALATAEISARIYQRNPPVVSQSAIRQMSARAVDTFLWGVEAR